MSSALTNARPCARTGCSASLGAHRRMPLANAAPQRSRSHRSKLCLRVRASKESEGDHSEELTLPADWRDFRARLVAAEKAERAKQGDAPAGELWAHGLALPEQGCLLLAHPKLFSASQPYFFRSVIFLFEHSAQGAAGIILNRPTEYQLGQIEGAEKLLPQFAKERLYLGGDVGRSTMHLMHGCPDIEGSKEVVPGVAVGGFEGARAAVEAGTHTADSFKFYHRYCGWGPGQLEGEVKTGTWSVAACSRELLLSAPPKGGPHAMWAQTLRLMGGEYAELANAGEEDARRE